MQRSHANGRNGHRVRSARSPISPSHDKDGTGAFGASENFVKQLDELREYCSYYVQVQIDRAKLSLRRMALYAVLALLGVFAAFAMVFAIVWLLLIGMAQGLGTLLGDRAWLGNISAALLTLLTLSAISWIAVARYKRRSYMKLIHRYRQRQGDQQARYGRTVQEQADGD